MVIGLSCDMVLVCEGSEMRYEILSVQSRFRSTLMAYIVSLPSFEVRFHAPELH